MMDSDPSPSWADARRQLLTPELWDTLRHAAGAGFLGPMALTEQVDHALGFVWVVESVLRGPPASVLDLGTGGGVPGLVLASCWPAARVVLVESQQRRVAHLERARASVPEPGNLEVVGARAELLGRRRGYREAFEAVTARSFGPPAVTAECGAPFVGVGGVLVASEPPADLAAPDRWPGEGLAQLSLHDVGMVRFESRFGYRTLGKSGSISSRFPRRTGIPAKRPLFPGTTRPKM